MRYSVWSPYPLPVPGLATIATIAMTRRDAFLRQPLADSLLALAQRCHAPNRQNARHSGASRLLFGRTGSRRQGKAHGIASVAVAMRGSGRASKRLADLCSGPDADLATTPKRRQRSGLFQLAAAISCAWGMAVVRHDGSSIVAIVPRPIWLSRVSRPPWISTIFLANASPKPVPPFLRE